MKLMYHRFRSLFLNVVYFGSIGPYHHGRYISTGINMMAINRGDRFTIPISIQGVAHLLVSSDSSNMYITSMYDNMEAHDTDI